MKLNTGSADLQPDVAYLSSKLEPMNRLQQAMWVYDLDHHQILWCNKSSLPIWDADSVESLQSRQMSDDMSVSVAKRLAQYQDDFSRNPKTRFRDVWTVYPKGDPITLEVVFSAFALPSGRVAMFCETKQNDSFDAEALRSAEALLHTSVHITLYAASGEPLYRNPAARSSVLSADESLHEHFVDQHTMRQLQDPSTHELKTVANVNTTKGLRWHDITALRCTDAVSGEHAWLITEVDVSQLKATEEHAQFLAEHDTLTQLPNRNHVSIAFQSRIDELLRQGQQGCLVFIDLDQFKDVNDSLGHAAGDQLLIGVAKRLSAIVELEDSVARLGGDEFLLLVSPISDADDIECYLDKLKAIVSQPMLIQSREIKVTPSIGVARFPDDGRNIQDLMRHADLAMYHAKDRGRNNYAFFDKSMSEAVESRVILESELQTALEQDQFVSYFQPRVDVATNEIIGAEALVRWLHPTKGLVPPGAFIPACEASGLIKELGKIVLSHSVMAQQLWAEMGFDIRISVNLSPIQFSEPSLVEDLGRIVAQHGGTAENIELEITESVLLGHDESTIDKLHELVELGFRVAIDDFGTGYSNLAYIHRYPIRCIKIDRSFVQALDTAQPIVELIISMAKLFQMSVVAEGVETPEQLEILRKHQCQEYQGFLFEKPIDFDSFTQLLTQKQLKTA